MGVAKDHKMRRVSARSLVVMGLRIAIVTYLALGALLFFFQRQFLYYPSNSNFGECPVLAEATALTLPGGARGYFEEIGSDRLAVLYHGNAGSACDRAFYADVFEQAGYSYLIVEYAGYGNDARGGPNIERILTDASEIAAYVEEQGFSEVLLVGNSLGASVAAYHASLNPPQRLVLTNPTFSVEERAREMYPMYPVSLLLREKYDTFAWASRVPDVEVRLIHAAGDSLVPPSHSQRLLEALPQKDKTLTLIDGADHNTVFNRSDFWEAFYKAVE